MIPVALRERPHWVAWRSETRDGKPTKVPYQARNLDRRASVTDPETWASYDEALEASQDADGVGFVFTESDPFVGVDLDACVNGEGAHPAAAKVIRTLRSYTERSCSRKGFHVIVRGRLNGGRNRTSSTPWGGCIEIYGSRRFFCMTGDHDAATSTEIEDRQSELDALVRELLTPAAPVARDTATTRPVLNLDDEELLERARNAKDGAKFAALYAGQWEQFYGSQSEADAAFCQLLAFWTAGDHVRIDRLFRRSGLLREKWDSQRGDSTYGEREITKAVARCRDFYEPPKAAPAPSDTSSTDYAISFDAKGALILPDPPTADDIRGHCRWLTATYALDSAHPIISGKREGLQGPDGRVTLRRHDAPPIRHEPVRNVNTPARLIEDLSWHLTPTDGAVPGFKAEHCRKIAHVIRMLCGATEALTDEQETLGILDAFTHGAELIEGFTTYGGGAQEYEAVVALQREADDKTGRPIGQPRYLRDSATGEYVVRVIDLEMTARRQCGSLRRGWLDGRMAGIGWDRVRLDGHEGGHSSGHHARASVYRGHFTS